MRAPLAFALLSTAVAAAPPPAVGWILGPADVALEGGELRCALPAGVALAAGTGATVILSALSPESGGAGLAVLSPVAPSESWYAVVARRRGAPEPSPPAAGRRAGGTVWLEAPRRDERTGWVTWTVAGGGPTGPTVNQHVLLPAAGGELEVTLVASVEELSAARAVFARIVDGLRVAAPPGAGSRTRP